jgi:uncharacterized protein (DUF305 family)
MQHSMWIRLAIMTVLGFAAMYILMYTMVDKWADFYPSISMAYMAGSMAAAMVVIELIVMSPMYKNAMIRNVLIGVSTLLLVAFIAFTRYQTGIGDKDFLRSMIPHHSGAILMCENPRLEDPAIRKLCSQIIEAQQREINEMTAIMHRK